MQGVAEITPLFDKQCAGGGQERREMLEASDASLCTACVRAIFVVKQYIWLLVS